MLSSIRIKNFKAWKDTGNIRLAPLTVIFGANSAGKSSLGHLLLALKQTALSSDRRRALHLGDTNSLIDLGTFRDCLYTHDSNNPLTFHLSWPLAQSLDVRDPVKQQSYNGNQLALDVAMKANKTGQPEVTALQFSLANEADVVLDIAYERKNTSQFELTSKNYNFIRTQGRAWPLDEPEKFYRISEQVRERFRNAGFLSDFALATETMLSRFYYLGPLREYPKRTYQWAGDTPEDVGHKGEYAIAALLAAQSQGRQLSGGFKQRQKPFAEFIAGWLQKLGIIYRFSVKPVAEGHRDYEVLIQTHTNASEVKITDVGFGVSQVLPALVEAFYCPPGSVVWMEQPEIHLHPQVQSELADVFISAIKARENGQERNVQLIVESHSEHFLNRLQRRIAEGTLSPDDVAIYFCKRQGQAAELETLRINEYGDIENWPENFFGDEMEDLAARTRAAMNHKQKELKQ